MKLTNENQDEMDSRPPGRTTGVDSPAFREAMARIAAEREAAQETLADKKHVNKMPAEASTVHAEGQMGRWGPFPDVAPAPDKEPDADVDSPSLIPRAWFGTATTPLPDPADGEEEDSDDEELDETPPDVIAMLGFDPKECADEGDGSDPEPDDD